MAMGAKEISIADLKAVLSYDESTGVFTWAANMGRNARIGSQAGTITRHGYIAIIVMQKIFLAHRLAWFYTTGSWPTGQIDHKDGVRTNNRFDNLRDVPGFVNAQNLRTAKATNKSSGLLGAHLHKCGRWMANIGINGKMKHLGLFDTPEEAHQAYLSAKRSLHEGCLI